jgi:hypothetical protein
MEEYLSTPTLLLIISIEEIVVCAMLLYVDLRRKTYRGFRDFAYCTIAGFQGFALLASTGRPPPLQSSVGGYGLVILSIGFIARGLDLFINNIGLMTGLIVLNAQRMEFELKAALEEVQSLGGLIPICASSKKVRNDKGYWEHAEQYFHEHNQAEFTHSICPDCHKTLCPAAWREIYGEGGEGQGDDVVILTGGKKG